MFFQGRLDLTIRGSLPLYFDLVIVRGDKPRMQRMGIFNDFIQGGSAPDGPKLAAKSEPLTPPPPSPSRPPITPLG